MSADATTPVTDPALPDPNSRSALGGRAARGALFTVSAQVVKILVQVAGVVVLARLLSPGDYGLVAMVTAIIGVAEIFRDFGLSAAAVQAKTLTTGQRDNLFWINTAAGAFFTLLVFFGAPLIAVIYGRPELVDLTRALSFVFVINGMTTQYRAGLNRSMRFNVLALADIFAPLLALVTAIVLALNGAGFWALAVQQLAMAVLLLLITSVGSRWLPRRPRREPMGDLLSFGWQLAGSLFIGYLGNNVDSLTIGIRFGPTPLGLYNRAFQLLMTPLGQLRAPTTQVALPVLSRLREDLDGSNRYLQRGQLALGMTLVAGLGLIIGGAEPVAAVFLGSKWLSVEPVLRLLAAAGVFQTLAYVGLWIYLSHGLTKQLFQYTLISTSIKVACILIGSLGGLIGVAWGYALAPALAWPLSFWWLSRKASVAVRPLFLGAFRVVIMTALVAAGSYGASEATVDFGRWIQLAAAVLGGAVCYLLATVAVRPLRQDVLGVLEIARKAVQRR